jgi:predicted PurR-regulated permease PerM
VFAVLYFARTVFIPLALSLLVSFLLAPLVVRLRHLGFGRIPAVVSVVSFAFLAVALVSGFMVLQLTDLARQLPGYQQNVERKLESIRNSGGSVVARVTSTVHNLAEKLTPPAAATPGEGPPGEKPVPVEVRRAPFSPMEVVQTFLESTVHSVLIGSMVVVFVIFMLIEREELRNRLIRLAGAGRVSQTTTLLDDAAHRVSRYLLAQLVLNVSFGLLAGIGLYFLKVPNPVLWGLAAALLRYIPYLGIWVAALMPAALAFAVEPGWIKVPLVFAVYLGIDLLMYNFAEPLLYGTSTGISPLAILVAAVFWTWLWGPVGLLLATPLTVCVVVVGRHVPSLAFLNVLLSDEPTLPVKTRFYQRMLAMDLEEATDIATDFLKGRTLEELYDEVVIPALSLAEEDRHRGRLDQSRYSYLIQNTRMLLDDLGDHADELISGNHPGRLRNSTKENERPASASDEAAPAVLCLPARDEADEIAGLMLVQLLARRGIPAQTLPAGTLVGEILDKVCQAAPKVACIVAVPPFGYLHARYLSRRLQAQCATVKAVGAILTGQDVEEIRRRQPPMSVDELASSITQAQTHVLALLTVQTAHHPQPVLRAA